MKRYTRLNKRWKSAFVIALCIVCMGFTMASNAKSGTIDYELLYSSDSDSGSSECSHDWMVTSSVKANCQKEGSISYACSKCGKTKTEVVPKADHSYVLVSETKPTLFKAGEKNLICKNCKEILTVTIPAIISIWLRVAVILGLLVLVITVLLYS